MKKSGIMIVLGALLFSSCIVKSLQPFYVKESLSFNENLLGYWTDNKKGQWTVESIRAKFEEDRKDGVKMSEEDLLIQETYKEGYYIQYIKKEQEAGFIAMPFKIDDQYFLDFIPIEIEDEEINSLAAEHLLKTHSVAKLDVNSHKDLVFSWLSEERIQEILNESRMRIKHESIGPQETLLLTASSEELYDFLRKYLKANIEDKWKASDQLNLSKVDAKP